MAVYTQVADDELAAFLGASRYRRARFLQGHRRRRGELQLFSPDRPRQFHSHALRKAGRPADLPFFLGLMDHLAARDIVCPTPIHARDGEALRTLAGRPAAIISFLQGVSPAPGRYPPLRAARPGAGGNAPGGGRLRHGPAERAQPLRLAAAVRPLAARAPTRCRTAWPARSSRSWNFWRRTGRTTCRPALSMPTCFPTMSSSLDDRVSGVIDFYFACNDSFAYDLAICINAWCFEKDGSFNVTKARHILNAYRSVRPVLGGGAGGNSGAAARRRAALPADPPARLVAPSGGGDGDAAQPAGIPSQAALPSGRNAARRAGAGLKRFAEGNPMTTTGTDAAGARGARRSDLYTDGACSGNPGPGGWGVLIRRGAEEETRCGGAPETTNNRMRAPGRHRGAEGGAAGCRGDAPYRQQLCQGRHHALDRRVEGRRLEDGGAQTGEGTRDLVAGTATISATAGASSGAGSGAMQATRATSAPTNWPGRAWPPFLPEDTAAGRG